MADKTISELTATTIAAALATLVMEVQNVGGPVPESRQITRAQLQQLALLLSTYTAVTAAALSGAELFPVYDPNLGNPESNARSLTLTEMKKALGLVPGSKFTLNAGAGPLVAAAGDLTGASDVSAQYSGINGATLTTRTATQMFTDGGVVQAATGYNLRILNTAVGALTLVPGVGVTIGGRQVIPGGTYADYVVAFTSGTTLTMQSVGSGTAP